MNKAGQVTVYSKQNRKVTPLTVLREIFKELPEGHELGLRLFKRNLKGQYRQSILGFAWALLPALVTSLLWIMLQNNRVLSIGETDIPYPVFVLIGTLLWKLFGESIMAPLASINSNKAMLVKINIPRTGLLLSGLYQIFFDLVIKLLMITIILLYFQPGFGVTILWVPLGILGIILSGYAIGLVLVPIGMLYTDVQRGLSMALPFCMYLTPVVYPIPNDGFMASLMRFNPLATFIPACRDWLTGQPFTDWNATILWSGLFGLLLLIGLVLFKLAMPIIIERIGS